MRCLNAQSEVGACLTGLAIVQQKLIWQAYALTHLHQPCPAASSSSSRMCLLQTQCSILCVFTSCHIHTLLCCAQHQWPPYAMQQWHPCAPAGAEALGVPLDTSAAGHSAPGAYTPVLPTAPALHSGPAGTGESSGPIHPPLSLAARDATGACYMITSKPPPLIPSIHSSVHSLWNTCPPLGSGADSRE